MTESGGYEQHDLFVGSYESSGGERVEFSGKKLAENHVLSSNDPEGERANHFTLYETPDGERLIYEEETLVTGSMLRRRGQPPVELRMIRADLYSLEEAREKGPMVREMIKRFREDL